VVLDVLANDYAVASTTLTITHLNGVPATAGQTVTLPSGQTVTLNADGTLSIAGDGQVETKSFTYGVSDTLGNTATGIVTVNQVPCFVSGTRILTVSGEVSVERLVPGDLVMTLDDGPQPLRWIGQRTVLATDAMAPVRLNAGTFGRHRTLWLSPQHRVLIRDPRAELLFGETEVLVAAQDLVNGLSVVQVPGGFVTYVHLLFDRHQVISSEGLATESFQPGPAILPAMEDAERAEIALLFPEHSLGPSGRCPQAARRVLRRHEARVLLGPPRLSSMRRAA
jgi:Hint domain/Bacterial Ig domain